MVDFVPFTGLLAGDNNTVYPANYVVLSGASGTVAVNSNIYVSSTGSVGIGTTANVYDFEVGTNQNAATVLRVINQNAGASAAAVLQLAAGSTPGGVNWTCYPTYNQLVGANGVASNYFDFDTQLWRSNAGTEYMRLDTYGNLSIGTSSVALPVGGRKSITLSGTSTSLITLQTGANVRGYLYNDGTNMLLAANTGTLFLQTVASQPVIFQTGATESMRIDTAGNVAIGTGASATSGYRLEVSGNISATGTVGATADSTQVATTAWVRDQGGFQTQVILTTGTNVSATLPAWANKAKVTVVGAGGAGGGNPATVGAPGSGGGSGAVSIKYFTGVGGATYTYNVGVAGAGVLAAAGTPGRASNLLMSGTLVNAPGGTNGLVGGAASTNIAGGAGGVAGTGGDVNLPGSAGGASQSTAAAATCASGFGAPGFMGLGGAASVIKLTAASAAGNAGGANTGAGGSGSAPGLATATTGTGGAGGSGLIIIEY